MGFWHTTMSLVACQGCEAHRSELEREARPKKDASSGIDIG